MPVLWTTALILTLAALGFVMGRARALSLLGSDGSKLHSLPAYHGWSVALATLLPALAALWLWALVQPSLLERQMLHQIGSAAVVEPADAPLMVADIRRVATGLDVLARNGLMAARDIAQIDSTTTDLRGLFAANGVALGSDVPPHILSAAQSYRATEQSAAGIRTALVLALAVIGFGLGLRRVDSQFRARNSVERVVLGLLVLASGIAIATTVGIILSMLVETRSFFQLYDWKAFFFSPDWSPQFHGGSDLGILPLLWGTLYISVIALIVAVPIGLFAAIYLSEYATRRMRATLKPVIEVLAGIPTIVYGLFALATVGPMLRDYFAQPLGLGTSSASVMTAGLVMGIMLIPFVSSLSDDVVSQVPQAMRDGSLALGATKSETIRQVIVPAALPGIVGAVLLAASRAIGETMIVVLGAGAAAKLSLNPFEAMTTITVKIVSQLTGDSDFAAPETLVAFALGLTLFCITLGLNVIALFVVRRYRERYE